MYIGHYHEGYGGLFEYMTVEELRTASREALIRFLEHRGFACYDDEPTELLRQTAIEDILEEG